MKTRIILILFTVAILSGCGPKNLNFNISEPIKSNNQTQIGLAYDKLNVSMVEMAQNLKKKKYEELEPLQKASISLQELSILRDNLVVTLEAYRRQPQYADEVLLGDNLAKNISDLIVQISRYLNLSKGYTQASFDWNLSYLTSKNEQLFNKLNEKVLQSSKMFVEALRVFSLSSLGNIPISKELHYHDISLHITESGLSNSEEVGRLQPVFKKHLGDYGFRVLPNQISTLVVNITSVKQEGSLDIAGKIVLSALIPNDTLARTKNQMLLKITFDSANETCTLDFMDKIDASFDNWEDLENFLVKIAVEELRYGKCFKP